MISGAFTGLEMERGMDSSGFFYSEGYRHDRAVLSAVTSYHIRDDSVMFVNSLLWCFRQTWWVERQEIYSVMSPHVKNIIGKCFVIIACNHCLLVFKIAKYVKSFQETSKKLLFPQIICSHGRLSSAGVHVCFSFLPFFTEAKKKIISTFSVVKWRENKQERRTAMWVGSHYLFDLLRGKFR